MDIRVIVLLVQNHIKRNGEIINVQNENFKQENIKINLTMKLFNTIKNIFVHKPPLLGRWKLKHNEEECHNYIVNIHADPGYPSNIKEKWLEKLTNLNKKA